MEIIIENKKVVNIIKDYYSNNYDIKSCKVVMEAENIRDKIREIDLFHRDKFYYNILFKATIRGKIEGHDKRLYNYYEELDEDCVKNIITQSLSEKFDIGDIKFGYNFFENNVIGGIDVRFQDVRVDINKKTTKKNVKNK